jgi:hypothetical protein
MRELKVQNPNSGWKRLPLEPATTLDKTAGFRDILFMAM